MALGKGNAVRIPLSVSGREAGVGPPRRSRLRDGLLHLEARGHPGNRYSHRVASAPRQGSGPFGEHARTCGLAERLLAERAARQSSPFR